MRTFKNNFLHKSFVSLFLLLKLIYSQNVDFPLGIESNYTADLEKFFRIDTSQAENHKNLIFHISPLDNYEGWSDPDIYISKINNYPSAYNSDYLSNKLGDDILIIPTSELKNVNFIYATVTCGKKCTFKAKVYYEDNEINILKNQEILLKFTNESETEKVLKFFPEKNTENFYEIYSRSLNLVDFEMIVELQYKSQKSIIEIKNSWYSGFSSILDPRLVDNSLSNCQDCYYRVIISAKPNAVILLGVKEAYKNKDLVLDKFYMGSLLPGKFECFFFNNTLFSDEQLKKQDDKLIILANSFTQDVGIVLLEKWENLQNSRDDGRIEFNFKDEMSFRLNFTQAINKYLCVQDYMRKFTTYGLVVYKESDSENMQKYNFLTNGISTIGFLPGNKVTSYKNWDNSLNSTSLSLNLVILEGNPILYAYVCVNVHDCHFTSENLEQFTPNLIGTSRINNEYNINIPAEKNACKKLYNENKNAYKLCGIVSIVKCEGTQECSFQISMHYSDGNYLLKERVKKSKFIGKNEYDYYKLTNRDKNSNKLTVVLHSHTGDADLYLSRNYTKPQEDPYVQSSTTSSGNRDYISLFDTTKDLNSIDYSSTLQGDFYIAVKGFASSFYSIYFYTSSDANTNDANRFFENGIMHSDILLPGQVNIFRFSNTEKKSKKPFLISLTSTNCYGNLTISSNDQDTQNSKLFSLTNNKTLHNQILLYPENSIYDSKIYLVKFSSFNFDKEDDYKIPNCLIYLSGLNIGNELMLNEGVPHIFTFNPKIKDMNTFYYVYPHIYQNKNPFLLNIFFENKNVDLQITISFENININSPANISSKKQIFKYNLFTHENILLKTSTLEKNCVNTFSCNIHIQVSNIPSNSILSKDEEIVYKITARSNNLIPIYIQKGKIKPDSVIPNNYQYYYTDIKKNEMGQVILNSKIGGAILVGKIVKKNQPKEPNADYNNVALPTQDSSSLIYSQITNSLSFTGEDTKDCQLGCELYFGVFSIDNFNYKDNVNEFSVLVSTGIINLNINEIFKGFFDLSQENSENIQYFTLEAKENQYSRISLSLTFPNNIQGKLLISTGEINENIPNPTLEKSYFISKENCMNCLFDYTLNKKSKKFIVGIYIDKEKYKNITNNISYEIYPADNSFINSKNFYEINLGDSIQCTTFYDDNYSDFLMVLPDTDLVVFYTQYIKEFFTNYDEHFSESVILANLYNRSDYNKLLEDETYRPRLDSKIIDRGGYMFRSGVITDELKEYLTFPDNNFLIFKNPYKNNLNEGFNTNYTQYLLAISVYNQKPSTFRLLNNQLNLPSSVMTLKNNMHYLFFVKSQNPLQIKIPEAFTKLRNLQALDINNQDYTYSLNIENILGEGTILYEQTGYKTNLQIKNLKIIINKKNEQIVSISAENHKGGKILPYACIVSLKYQNVKNELVLGDSFDILFPSMKYMKSFYFTAYNSTYGNVESDIDLTFNFKIVEYKKQNPKNVIGKNQRFVLKSHKTQSIFLKENAKDMVYDLGEYDPIHRIGMLTTKLEKSFSYMNVYDINLENEKDEKSDNKSNDDPLLMRITFLSDNFKYTKSNLPYKTYYYSSINSIQIYDASFIKSKVYHIHKLSRKNILDNFFYIELGSCGNEFSYSLRDYSKLLDIKDDDFFLNKTDLKHEYKYHYGKKVIEVELKDTTKDLLIVIFPLKTYLKSNCMEINQDKTCKVNLYSDYVIRYRTSKSKIDIEKYHLEREGLISLKFNKTETPTDFTITWGSVLQKNENYQYEILAPSKMIVSFYDADKIENTQINSICYFDNNKALVDYFEFDSIHRDQDYFIYNITKNINYHISIMAETKEDNSYLVYIPSYVNIRVTGQSVGIIICLVLLVIFLCFSIFYIYRKYRLTKIKLDYEINDVRNMASLPGRDTTSGDTGMITMTKMANDRKYLNLNEKK